MSIMWIERLNEWDGENGSLKAAGVTWVEERRAPKIIAVLVIAGCVLWVIFALTLSIYSGPPPWKLAVLSLAAYILGSVFTKHRRRVFMFGRDGGMAMPFGLSTYPSRVRAFGGHHDAIGSVQSQPSGGQRGAFHVEMVDGIGGNIFPIEKGLTREDAFKLTVQLNQALAFMRENARREEEAMSWAA